jgi:hypothetical protein
VPPVTSQPKSNSSTLKMEAGCSLVISVMIYQTMWHHILGDSNLDSHRNYSLKSHTLFLVQLISISYSRNSVPQNRGQYISQSGCSKNLTWWQTFDTLQIYWKGEYMNLSSSTNDRNWHTNPIPRNRYLLKIELTQILSYLQHCLTGFPTFL